MLDIKLIRKKPEEVEKALLKRMEKVDLGEILELDKRKRTLGEERDSLKARKNRRNVQIPQMQKNGENLDIIFKELKELSQEIEIVEKDYDQVQIKLINALEELPNIPSEHIVGGGKENNKVINVMGNKPQFSFNPKNHVELVEDLNLIDYERGVKLGGKGHWMYKGTGALLEWALLNYFIEEHVKDSYQFILPPHMLNYQCGYTAGHFPKFDEDVYYLDREKKSFLLPTAETALVNIHRDEILKEELLPVKYFAYTPCYRKEAGSYRTEERGMIRGHQFNKIELFQYTKPDDSPKALKELIEKVKRIMNDLELHYRVSQLAAGDCSASMAETIDIEVWIPSMNVYKEVSSASCAKDYQARRGNIRYKSVKSNKNEFVHTLNASGLATSRLIPAILEQHQQADGTVHLPKILQNRLGLGSKLHL